MKRILTIVSVLLIVAVPAAAQQYYFWTLSSSNSDPLLNAGPISGPPFPLFLWLRCAVPGGMAAAVFDLATPAGISNFGFTPMNGFLNAGGASNLLLAVGGCPQGPVVAGSWTLFGSTAGGICLVNSAADGIRVTVDCDPINPQAWPIYAIGYGYGTVASCVEPSCVVFAVEPTTWGRTKTLYR